MPTSPLGLPLPRRVPLTIEGKVAYPPGPWGNGHGVRGVKVELAARDLRFRGLTEIYAETVTDDDGAFKLVTFSPIDQHDGHLHLRIHPHYAPAFDHDIEKQVSLTFSLPQRLYWVVVSFKPPLLEFARVNGKGFGDAQAWARELARQLRAPSYPIVISLMHETVDPSQRSDAENLFTGMSPGSLPADVAVRVQQALSGQFNVTGAPGAPAMEALLRRLSSMTLRELQPITRTTPLGELLKGLASAMNGVVGNDPVRDPPLDIAAACTLILIAGLMARDNAKPTATLGQMRDSKRPLDKFAAVFVSIVR